MNEQLDLFPEPEWMIVIDLFAFHAQIEIRDMAEHARRSIGQISRLDHLQHRIERGSYEP